MSEFDSTGREGPVAPADLPASEGSAGSRPADGYRLRRSKTDRVLGGVCGGLGAAFGVDPLWFRLAFVVLSIGGGSGIAIYIVMLIIMPEHTEDTPIGRHPSIAGSEGTLIGGILLIGLGAVLLANALIPWFDRVAWPMLFIAAGVAFVLAGGRNGTD